MLPDVPFCRAIVWLAVLFQFVSLNWSIPETLAVKFMLRLNSQKSAPLARAVPFETVTFVIFTSCCVATVVLLPVTLGSAPEMLLPVIVELKTRLVTAVEDELTEILTVTAPLVPKPPDAVFVRFMTPLVLLNAVVTMAIVSLYRTLDACLTSVTFTIV